MEKESIALDIAKEKGMQTSQAHEAGGYRLSRQGEDEGGKREYKEKTIL
jgi:hypothetical protein